MGWPKPRSMPRDSAPTSSASRTRSVPSLSVLIRRSLLGYGASKMRRSPQDPDAEPQVASSSSTARTTGDTTMPKVSKQTAAQAQDIGVGKDLSQVLQDQPIN